MTLARVRTDFTEYFPMAVSFESMIASVLSKTAFAASDISARVGLEFSTIDARTWVAVMTGFAWRFDRRIRAFCTIGTFSGLISIPRSPRATIIPSASSTIFSISLHASWRSIFAIIFGLWDFFAMIVLRSRMSFADFTNDRAI